MREASMAVALTLPMRLKLQEVGMFARFSSVSTFVLLTAGSVLVWPSSASAQDPLVGKTGSADGNRFGSAIATIGDVDNDGVDDVLVGEPNYTVATSTEAGHITVYSGRTGAVIRTDTGFFGREHLGTCVARAGDIDGDGVDEYLVGDPGFVQDAGAVYIYNGKTGARYYYSSLVSGTHEGDSVAGLGDVDGDGVPDFVVGAPKDGSISVVSGKTNHFLYGRYDPNPGNLFGASIAGCGDLDHDGFAD